MRRLAFAVAVHLLVLTPACVRRVDTAPGEPRVVRLIADTPERETTELTEKRADLEIDTRDHERTPRVVATGETPLLELRGLTARLYGDQAATAGFSVDNFLLIEVLAADGKVLDRVCVGFTDGVQLGKERLDNLGRQAFRFEAGEVNLTPRLPLDQPFKLRATALDYHGVGRVTDVFVGLRAEAPERTGDELKGQ
jgi:hypothetical protein